MKNIELLAPAGDINKLKTALHFGADAVYLGGKNFGLRAGAGNFDESELTQAVQLAHSKKAKVYVTVNVFARNDEFDEIKQYIKFLENIGVDAVIVSDLGVLRIVRENTRLPIHISTQANVVNKFTAEEYAKLGATRIILARECTLVEIKEIASHLKGHAEVEVFVHGAMCMSYSGRCLLSNYLTGRDANHGACAQPCRWKYHVMEEKRPGEYLPVLQDNRGTYIMNSRDLCLVNHLQKLATAGVTSFKIEGRMKGEYYVAGTVNTYKRAMQGENFNYIEELEKISHRHLTTGFVFDKEAGEFYNSNTQIQTHEIVAIVTDTTENSSFQDNKIINLKQSGLIEQRNLFEVGDILEILSPTETFNKTFAVTKITTLKGESIQQAKKVQELLYLECPHKLESGDVLRKELKEKL